jgi:uncharacterized Zn ribbon protein
MNYPDMQSLPKRCPNCQSENIGCNRYISSDNSFEMICANCKYQWFFTTDTKREENTVNVSRIPKTCPKCRSAYIHCSGYFDSKNYQMICMNCDHKWDYSEESKPIPQSERMTDCAVNRGDAWRFGTDHKRRNEYGYPITHAPVNMDELIESSKKLSDAIQIVSAAIQALHENYRKMSEIINGNDVCSDYNELKSLRNTSNKTTLVENAERFVILPSDLNFRQCRLKFGPASAPKPPDAPEGPSDAPGQPHEPGR